MKLKIAKRIGALFCLVSTLTGCYKSELEDLKKQVGDLDISGIQTQVNNMEESVGDLRAIQEKVDPIVEGLLSSRDALENELAAAKSIVGSVESASVEQQALIVSLQAQIDAIEVAVRALDKANLEERINEVESLLDSVTLNYDARMLALSAQMKAYATLEDLASVSAAIESVEEAFDSSFVASLENSKDRIIAWVSESQTFKDLFENYYTAAEMNSILYTQNMNNAARAEEIQGLQTQVDEMRTYIPAAITEAIENGPNTDIKKLWEEIERINGIHDELAKGIEDLTARIEALEKLYDVVGDYSNYKGTLVADILSLQEIVGDNDHENSLVAIVNTLKLLLTNGEKGYYNLGEIVAGIAENRDSIDSKEVRISYLEELSKTFASLTDFISLSEDVNILRDSVNTQGYTINSLTQIVDRIVDKWTSSVYDQIWINRDSIKVLNEEKEKLWFALGDKENPREGSIYYLINCINAELGTININLKNHSDSLDIINSILTDCNVGEIKGLQACLDNLDSRIKSLWDIIGVGTLDIGTTIIDAINLINGKFGNLNDSTVADILAVLKNDLALIKGNEWTEGLSLTSLKSLLDDLVKIAEGKATKKNFDEVTGTVGEIQETIKTFITTDSVNVLLSNYLLTSDAEKTYAVANDLTDFINLYNKVVGADKNQKGSILAMLDTLNQRAGTGVGLTWAENLTDAVNKLHGLVGETSVSSQATAIAQGIVNDLIKGILGYEGDETKTAADIAALLKKFDKAVDEFTAMKVVLGDSTYTHDRLDDAIEAVYNELQKYKSDYNEAKGTFESLSERLAAMDARCDAIEALIGTGVPEAYGTVKDALDSLSMLFGDMKGSTVSGLFAGLQGLQQDLVNALLGVDKDGKIEDIDASLSLTSLKARLDTLGFTDIKNAEGKNLVEVLEGINADLAKLFGTIGGDFEPGEGKTVADAINEIKDSLGTFSNSKYEERYEDIEDLIQSIIDALTGSESGAGDISNVSDLKQRIDDVKNRVDNFSTVSGKTLESVINGLYHSLDSLNAIVGNPDWSGFTTITDELAALKEKIENTEYWAEILENSESASTNLKDIIEKIVGIKDLEKGVGDLDSLIMKIDNKTPTSLVAAINELYNMLKEIQTKVGDKLTQEDIDKAREDILGVLADDDELKTIAALSNYVTMLQTEILGDRTGVDKTVYEWLAEIEATINGALGTSEEGKTVWSAIKDLQDQIDAILAAMESGGGAKSLNELLYSFVYIPQYADGKAWLEYVPGSWAFGNLVMNFTFTASDTFKSNLKNGKYEISGFLKDVKTRAAAEGEKIDGTVNLDRVDEGVIKVKFAGTTLGASSTINNLRDNMNKKTAQISVMIYDKDNSNDRFNSQYVVLGFQQSSFTTALDLKVDEEDNARPKDFSLAFHTRKHPSTYTINVHDHIGNGYTMQKSEDNWMTVKDDKDGTIEVSVNDNCAHSGGWIKVLANESSEVHTISIEESTYSFGLGNGVDGLTKSGSSTLTAATGIAKNYSGVGISVGNSSTDSYSDGYKVTYTDAKPDWLTVSPNSNNTFSVEMAKNYGNQRSAAVRLSPAPDGYGDAGFDFTVVQPKLEYSFALGDMPKGVTKDGNVLTAVYAEETYVIPFTCAPDYQESQYAVSVEQTGEWLTLASETIAKGGDLEFSLAENKGDGAADRTATVTIYALDDTGNHYQPYEISVMQKAFVQYSFGLGDMPTGLSKDGNAITAAGDAGKYTIPLTSTPEGYIGNLAVSVERGDGWLTVDNPTDGLSLNVKLTDHMTGDRNATITVTSEDGASSSSFTLTQSLKQYSLALHSVDETDKNPLGAAAISITDKAAGTISTWWASEHTYSVTLDLKGFDASLLEAVSEDGCTGTIGKDGKLQLKVPANTSNDAATRTITIKAKEGDNVTPLTLSITQLGCGLFASKAALEFSSKYGSDNVKVTNNFDYKESRNNTYSYTANKVTVSRNSSFGNWENNRTTGTLSITLNYLTGWNSIGKGEFGSFTIKTYDSKYSITISAIKK